MAVKKKAAKKKSPRKTNKAKPNISKKKFNSLFDQIDEVIQKGLTVDDIFVIKFLDDDDTGALMHVGFTEIGTKAIADLMKRNPKITEKDIEDYVRKISARLIVLVSERIKEEERQKEDEQT